MLKKAPKIVFRFESARVKYTLSLMLGVLSIVLFVLSVQMNFYRHPVVVSDEDQLQALDIQDLQTEGVETGLVYGAADQEQEVIPSAPEEEIVIDSPKVEPLEEVPKPIDFYQFQSEHSQQIESEMADCLNGNNGFSGEYQRQECVRIRRKLSCVRRSVEVQGLLECLLEYGKGSV